MNGFIRGSRWKRDQRKRRRVALPQPIDDEDADGTPTEWTDGEDED